MQVSINGISYDIAENEVRSALDFIRMQGLTGAKKVCGSGVCGACTIVVDGKTVNSCVTPIQNLAGKNVKTVESFSQEKEIHPIQKAFIANDAMQCGFCTPGFVVEAINFYETWKVKHGSQKPTHKEIAAALEGHLCRCAAYPNIYKAVELACSGVYENVVDYDKPRYDSLEKSTGRAKYTQDILLPNMLFGYVYRSPHAHAVVTKINKSELLSFDDVEGFVDLLPPSKTVRYFGQPIFAVALKSNAALKSFLNKVTITYDVKACIIDNKQAQKDSAPIIYNSKRGLHDSSEGLGYLIPGDWNGNTRKIFTLASIKRRTAKATIESAKYSSPNNLVELAFSTGDQIHTPLEPHVCISTLSGDGHLHVYLSTQGVGDSANSLAKKLKLPKDDITVYAEYVGGGFGNKLSLTDEAFAAASLCLQSKKPVRVEYSREEELSFAGTRPASDINVKAVITEEGDLKAFSIDCYSYAGVGAGYVSSIYLKHVYGNTPRALQDIDVFTNKPPARPFRAPGACRAFFALESSLDQLIHNLSLDPITSRMRWESHPNVIKLLEAAQSTAIWEERSNMTKNGRFVRGIGLASAVWPYWYSDNVEVELVLSKRGLTASTAAVDLGTGAKSVISNALIEVLGIPANLITVNIGSSNFSQGVTAGGSMTTPSTYYAVVKAATRLKDDLREKLNLALDSPIKWHDVLTLISNEIMVKGKRGADSILGNNATNYLLDRNSSANVVVSEVEVDMLLKKFKVTRVWSGVSAGKIVAPTLAENQVYGGIIQGIGYALFEQKLVDSKSGVNLTNDMENYKVPGISDTPKIEVYFYEGGFEHVKGNAIGLAEVVAIPMAASIANAIFNATGKRVTTLPVSFESYE